MYKDDKPFKIVSAIVITALLLTSTYAFAGQKNASDQPEKAKKTIEVVRKDYVEKFVLKGLECQYLISDALTIEEPKGVLEEYLVASGQEVKKGDHLIAYRIQGSKVDLEEKKILLKQTEKDYKLKLVQNEEAIGRSIQELSIKDLKSIDAQLLQLQIQKQQIANEQYRYQTAKSMKDQGEAIEKLEETIKLQYITAPYDGQVYIKEEQKQGTILNPDIQLIYIMDTKSAVLSSEVSSNNKQWYNMQVSIEGISRMKSNQDRYVGKVITADSLFNGKVSTGKIYILPDKKEDLLSMQSANISATSVTVKNVLVIPNKCVKSNKDFQFVYILGEDGLIRKQYITGRNNGSEMWVYNGITEGQKIIAE